MKPRDALLMIETAPTLPRGSDPPARPRSIDRPVVPSEYGVPASTADLLPWSHVEGRLAAARVYWIATSGPGGRPRVRPVDGLWHDGVLYVGGSPETRWVRDLLDNPEVAVHLDDGMDVVILEGVAESLDEGVSLDTAVRLAALSNEKYPQYGVTPELYTGPGPIAIRPRVAFAWTAFPTDVTRFRFG